MVLSSFSVGEGEFLWTHSFSVGEGEFLWTRTHAHTPLYTATRDAEVPASPGRCDCQSGSSAAWSRPVRLKRIRRHLDHDPNNPNLATTTSLAVCRLVFSFACWFVRPSTTVPVHFSSFFLAHHSLHPVSVDSSLANSTESRQRVLGTTRRSKRTA